MKSVLLLTVAVLALLSLSDARKRPGIFLKRLPSSDKGGKTPVSVTINDKEKLLSMAKNEKLDRKTRTYSVKDGESSLVDQKERGCFAQDIENGAALNICGETMEGVINDDTGRMSKVSKHPAYKAHHSRKELEEKGQEERRRREVDRGVLHQLTRLRREDDVSADFRAHIDMDAELSGENRKRRQTLPPEAEVELAFIADYAMFSRYGTVEATRDYILSVANIIDILYKTVTYPRVTISVSSIHVFTSPSSQSWINNVVYSDGTTVESGDLLDAFSSWLGSSPLDDAYDHAMLLSGLDFCSPASDGTCSTSNSGLAWVSSACRTSGSVVRASSVSEDHGGYSRIFTIAHELGHNLGAAHDGSSNSMGGPGATSCARSDGFIMGSPKLEHAFSTCSQDQFQYYMGLSQASCLFEQNSASLYTIPTDLPGASISLDQQCRDLYGSTSAKCSWKDTDVCDRLWCESGGGYCGTQGAAVMGTPCPGGFCYGGACVNSLPGQDVQDVDGGWSSWGDWGSCSVSCGGGTQTRTRSCSNPYPQGSGAQCSGVSSQTQTCGTDECPADPCQLPSVSVPSGCSDYNIIITYNGEQMDCQCFFHSTQQSFCSHYIADYCCESSTKVGC